MRTQEFQELMKKLSLINNYLQQSLFIQEQFFNDYNHLILSKPKILTKDTFPKIERSQIYNVRLRKLRDDLHELSAYTFDSIYIFTYTVFELYLYSLFNFVNKVCSGLKGTSDKEIAGKILERAKNLCGFQIVCSLCLYLTNRFGEEDCKHQSCFDQQVVRTFDYLRLRRNHIVHGKEKQTDALTVLINDHGSSLNKYWKKHRKKYNKTPFQSLNFQQPIILEKKEKKKGNQSRKRKFIKYPLSEEETIDILKLIRALGYLIDDMVIKSLDKDEIIQFALNEYRNQNQSIIQDKTRRKTTIHKFIKFSESFLNIKKKDILEFLEFNPQEVFFNK